MGARAGGAACGAPVKAGGAPITGRGVPEGLRGDNMWPGAYENSMVRPMLNLQVGASFLDGGWLVLGLQTLTLQLSGVVLLLIILGIGAYIGYLRVFRALLTVGLVSVIAYLI